MGYRQAQDVRVVGLRLVAYCALVSFTLQLVDEVIGSASWLRVDDHSPNQLQEFNCLHAAKSGMEGRSNIKTKLSINTRLRPYPALVATVGLISVCFFVLKRISYILTSYQDHTAQARLCRRRLMSTSKDPIA